MLMRLMFTLGRDQETFNYHFCTEFRGDSWQSAALGTCFELVSGSFCTVKFGNDSDFIAFIVANVS